MNGRTNVTRILGCIAVSAAACSSGGGGGAGGGGGSGVPCTTDADCAGWVCRAGFCAAPGPASPDGGGSEFTVPPFSCATPSLAWEELIEHSKSDGGREVLVDGPDGGFYLVARPSLWHLDDLGRERFRLGNGTYRGGVPLTDGGILIVGGSLGSGVSGGNLQAISPTGQDLWQRPCLSGDDRRMFPCPVADCMALCVVQMRALGGDHALVYSAGVSSDDVYVMGRLGPAYDAITSMTEVNLGPYSLHALAGDSNGDFAMATDAGSVGSTAIEAWTLGHAEPRWTAVVEATDVNDMVFTADGGLVVVGSKYEDQYQHARAAWAAQFDTHGTLVWEVMLGGRGDDAVRAVTLSPTGTLLFAGVSWSEDEPVQGWVREVELGGEEVWAYEVADRTTVMEAVIVLADGLIVGAAGIVDDSANGDHFVPRYEFNHQTTLLIGLTPAGCP